MFHITIMSEAGIGEDKNISFSFTHYRNVDFQIREDKKVSDVTYCDFLVNGTEFSGIAACSALDKFNKEVGRKVALKRAMEEAKLSRDERAYVWIRYFDRGVSNG